MTTKPDVIIVWGGHNDTSYRASPLGTWDDETTNSFKGALKHIAELAAEYAPDATLFVLTPLWTTEAPSTLKVPENTTDNNWMFVDAIYEGADIYGWIPINMDLCGITPFTKSGLLLDSIHPNEAGTETIVEYLSEELACYGANSKIETIIFNKPAVSMKTGESTTLKAVQSPRSGNGSPVFTWSSSNSSVATVDANGKITAVAHGNATITATADNDVSATVQVYVAEGEHTYESTVTAPTCTEQGYTTYTCECGDSYVADYMDATGHTYKNGICTGCGEHIGPVITQQPTNAETALGENYCVTVEAEGEGLKYQWYFRNEGSNIWYRSSVRTDTYTNVMTKARAGREIYCVITDALGNTVTTDVVKLVRVLKEELQIVTQPANATAALGDNYCVTVEAKGEGLKYQWYFRNAGSDKWYKSSVRDNTYDAVMTKARAGREVYCVITDALGNTVTTEIARLIRVPKEELKLTTPVADTYAALGQYYCVTVNAQGEGLKYTWYFRNAGSDTWYRSGVTDNTYDDVMTKARANREVYCVVTDALGNTVTTDVVTIYLNK